MQIQLDVGVAHELKRLAERRSVTMATFARLLVETAVTSPEWIDRLFDDFYMECRES
jgi:hypothetical protein